MEGLKSRAIALVVCVVLILVGWFGGNAIQNMGGGSLTSQASGLKPKTVVMQIGEQKVMANEYLYWLTSSCDMMYQYYGVTDWTMSMTEDMTVSDYVREQTDYYVSQYAAIKQLAAEQGITLTEEQQTELSNLPDYYVQYYGGEEIYDYMLAFAGLDEATLLQITEVPYLYHNLCEALLAEGGALEPTEENLQAFAERNQYTALSEEELLTYYNDTSYGAVYDYVNDYIDNMTVEKTADYDAIDVAAFYPAMMAARETLEMPATDAGADEGSAAE